MEEKWTSVVCWKNGIRYDFSGIYEISDLGRIRSLSRIDKSGHILKQKYLKTCFSNKNREMINLYYNNSREWFQISRLIWTSFNGPIPEGMQVNHIDENPANNRIDNLNLMTAKENMNWGTRNERAGINISKALKGKRNPKREVPVKQLTLDNILIKEWSSAREVQRQLGYFSGNITACCRGRINTAYGYKWSYKNI